MIKTTKITLLYYALTLAMMSPVWHHRPLPSLNYTGAATETCFNCSKLLTQAIPLTIRLRIQPP